MSVCSVSLIKWHVPSTSFKYHYQSLWCINCWNGMWHVPSPALSEWSMTCTLLLNCLNGLWRVPSTRLFTSVFDLDDAAPGSPSALLITVSAFWPDTTPTTSFLSLPSSFLGRPLFRGLAAGVDLSGACGTSLCSSRLGVDEAPSSPAATTWSLLPLCRVAEGGEMDLSTTVSPLSLFCFRFFAWDTPYHRKKKKGKERRSEFCESLD